MKYQFTARVGSKVQLYTSGVYSYIVQMLPERCLRSK
jgi:hypothetical protein